MSQGRLENEIKITEKINQKIKDMPAYVAEWHNYLQASNKTATTRSDFIYKIRRFLLYINQDVSIVSPDMITEDVVANYIISIKTKTVNDVVTETSDSYQLTVYSALNNFLRFLFNRGYIEKNYVLDIEKRKNNDLYRINAKRKLIGEREFKLMLHKACMEKDAVLKARDVAILSLFMSTGMRCSALRSINRSDIDFEENTLTVYDKGNKFHEYKLNDATVKRIKDWLAVRHCYVNGVCNDALFISNIGNRMHNNSITKVVEKYSYQATGETLSPHKLRSGVCRILYDKTHDIEFVRKYIGHSNVATTQRYLGADNEERKQGAQMLESIIA